MKTIIKYTCSLLCFAAMSCSLDEKPSDFLESDTFYKEDNHLIMAIAGCYDGLRNENYYGNQFPCALFASCDYGMGNTGVNSIQQFTRADVTSSHVILKNMWAMFYKTISRTNVVIEKAATAPDCTPELCDRVIGEAKFIRALTYFNLVRCFGESPLRLKPVHDFEKDIHMPASKIEDIYAQIIEDLSDAELKCWNRGETRGVFTNHVGQTTKLAATALLAKVYLHIASAGRVANTAGFYDGDKNNGATGVCDKYKSFTDFKDYYQLCYDACERALENPDFGYERNEWMNLWNVQKFKNIKEYIFAIQFSTETGYGCRLPFLFLPRGDTKGGSMSSQGGQNRFLKEFINQKLYDITDYRWNGFQLNIAFRDGKPAEEWRFDAKGQGEYYIPSLNKSGTGGGSKLLATSKFNDPATLQPASSQCELPVIRSIDIFLMQGEALAEINSNPTAGLAIINKVRQRVGSQDMTIANINLRYKGATEMDKFRDYVIHERLLEFAAEGDRWFTLKRMGQLINKCNLIKDKGNAAKTRVKENYYWPISQDEIDSNKLLDN